VGARRSARPMVALSTVEPSLNPRGGAGQCRTTRARTARTAPRLRAPASSRSSPGCHRPCQRCRRACRSRCCRSRRCRRPTPRCRRSDRDRRRRPRWSDRHRRRRHPWSDRHRHHRRRWSDRHRHRRPRGWDRRCTSSSRSGRCSPGQSVRSSDRRRRTMPNSPNRAPAPRSWVEQEQPW
jgi:hypothetical protein